MVTKNFCRVSDDNCPCDAEPFSPLNGESIEYMGPLQDDFLIAISNYRLFATQEDGFYSVSTVPSMQGDCGRACFGHG